MVAARSGARTVTELMSPVQTAISVVLPLSGILLVAPLRAAAGPGRAATRLVWVAAVATVCALVGVAVCVGVVASWAPPPIGGSTSDRSSWAAWSSS